MYLILFMLSDEHLLKEYHEFLLANRRKKTADIYLFLLTHYIEYLHSQKKSLHNAKAYDIQLYLSTKKNWKNTAKIMFITVIKTFYNKFYLNRIEIGVTQEQLRIRLQRENDIREINNYPLPHKETVQKNKALPLSSVKTLLDYAKKKNIDEYCLIYALFYFGCRKSELMYINPTTEIIWKENYLKITAEKSKTHVGRILYFNDYTKSVLIHILKTYGNKENLICKEDTFLNKVFYKYNRVVGVHLFPHITRSIWITEMQKSIKGKIDLDEITAIKILAGHNTGDMTTYYTNYQPYLKDIMLKFHYLLNI